MRAELARKNEIIIEMKERMHKGVGAGGGGKEIAVRSRE